MTVRSIYMHGALATKFGYPEISLDVASPREALNALANQVPGFTEYVRHYDWQIIVGDVETGRSLGANELDFRPGKRPFHIVPVVAGAKKGGAAKIIAGVVLIALTVVTAGMAAPIGAGALGMGATIGGTSITLGNVAMFGVSMVLSGVSSLLAPTPEFSKPAESVAQNSSHLFDGPQNVAEQGGPIPLVFGRFEVGTTVISSGISTEKVQIAEEKQPTGSTNDTNGSGGQGGSNDAGVIQFPDPDGPGGDGNQGAGEGDAGDGGGGGKKGGGKGGGGGGRVAKEAPNTLRSRATARILDLVSEGEIGGLVDGAKSIKIGGTPLMAANGKYNFSGVNWDSRVGLPDQTYMKGFSKAQTELVVDQEVVHDTPAIITVTDSLIDAVRVTVRIPSLYQSDPKTGDVNKHKVKFAFDVQSNGGGWKRKVTETIGPDKTTSPYERSYRINLPEGGAPWDIRMLRLSEDTDELIYADDTWFSRYTEIIDVKMMYPHCAYFGLEVDAEQFGDNVPERSYDIYGILVKVPSNYDWITRTYSTTIWDGTFHPVKVPSDNPAWIVYEIATNDRFGLADELYQMGVSKWDLYEIGKRCDQYVPDGFGGTEPRFTFNGEMKGRDHAQRIISYLVSTFLGMAYWGSGTLNFTQDAPKEATRLVTPANVIEGDFSYSGTSRKARHTAVHVKWYDPDDQCRPSAIEVVEDVEAIHRYGYRKKEVLGYGKKTRGGAHRLGKWILDTEQNSTEMVTYMAGLDHADAMPGEILQIADPKRMAVRMGGRIAGSAGTTITLDATFDFVPGEIYYLNAVLADMTVESRKIVSPPDPLSVISIEEAFTTDPPIEHMYTITSQSVALPLYTLLDREEVTETRYKISALWYDPTKFDRVEQDIVLDPPSFNQFPTGDVLPPTNPTHKEYLYKTADKLKSAVLFSWELPKDPRVVRYVVEYKNSDDGGWQEFTSTATNSVDIRDTFDGFWSFRVRSITGLGKPSEWLQLDVELLTLRYPPDNVASMKGVVKGDMMHLTWPSVANLDLDHYRLKFVYDGSPVKWSSGIIIDDAIPDTATSLATQALAGSYMIKAVDTSEVESNDYALVYSTVANLFDLNVVEEYPQEPLWAGTKTDLAVIDDKLYLAGGDVMADWTALSDVVTLYQGVSGTVATMGIYELPDVMDQGRVGTVRVTTELEVEGIALDGQGTELDSVNYEAWFEIATTDDDPNASPVWSDWERIVAGDYMNRAFKTRLIMKALDLETRPVASKANVIFDVPDRTERDQGVACPIAGIEVLYNTPFKEIPVLEVTVSNLQSGDQLKVDTEEKGRFVLHVEDSVGANVARTFNWIALGYGVST